MRPLPIQEENMEVRVKSPFTMGGQRYVEGDKINVEPEKAKSLAYSGLVVEAKVMDRPTKDKMVKSPVKKKSKRRK